MAEYLTIVPNTEFGLKILKQIKLEAKRNGWKIECRGRNKNRKAIAESLTKNDPARLKYVHENLRRSISVKHSDRIAVYAKKNGRNILPEEYTKMVMNGEVK